MDMHATQAPDAACSYPLDHSFFDEAFEAEGVPRPHYAPLIAELERTDLHDLELTVAADLLSRGVAFQTAYGRQPVPHGPGAAARERGGVGGARGRARAAGARAQRVPRRRLRRAPDRRGGRRARARDRGGRRPRPVDGGRARAARRVRGHGRARRGARRRRPLHGARGQPAHAVGPRVHGGRRDVLEERLPEAGTRPSARSRRCTRRSARRCGRPRPRASTSRRSWCSPTGRATAPGSSTRRSRGGWRCRSWRSVTCEPRAGRLYARVGTQLEPVDVVYRRTDEDRLADEHGRPTPLADALLDPLRRGTVACFNAFGTGLADDKLVHAYVEEMVRFYLGEEPLLGSVPTYDLGDPGAARARARAARRAGGEAAHRLRRLRRGDRPARDARGPRPGRARHPRRTRAATSRRRRSRCRGTRPSARAGSSRGTWICARSSSPQAMMCP